jgi:Ca-activated chloride channel family protein
MIFQIGSPYYLYLLLLIPVLVWFRYFRRRKNHAALPYSDTDLVKKVRFHGGLWPRYISPVLKSLALVAIVFALARPRFARTFEEVKTQGIDIVLTLDVSGSMKAEDFKPQNRLYVAKEVIKEFVQERTEDRLGLVVFAAQAFTQCPLTLDHNVLINFLDNVTFGMVEDGTAIGTAIANSCNRLKDSPAKSKVIVLLTDGVNNTGKIDPVTAAEIAKSLGIKIYTIGIGKPGNAPFPVDDPFLGRIYKYIPNALDEKVLHKVADITGGIYFRAETGEKLSEVYKEISALETTQIKTKGYIQYKELFAPFLLAGLGFVLLESVLGRTRFRKIP